LQFLAFILELHVPFAGTQRSSDELLALVSPSVQTLGSVLAVGGLHEFATKVVHVVDDRFFVNLHFDVYEVREARVQQTVPTPISLSDTRVVDRGFRVLLDVNTKPLFFNAATPSVSVADWTRCVTLVGEVATGGVTALLERLDRSLS
jgi:hypothetical protein